MGAFIPIGWLSLLKGLPLQVDFLLHKYFIALLYLALEMSLSCNSLEKVENELLLLCKT